MTESIQIAAALTKAAKEIHAPRSLEETLDAVVRAAQSTVPGFDHVGISVSHRDGRIETLAGTDPLVWELDELQYELRQGPCVESIRDEPVVTVEHAENDPRWPAYLPQAVRRGLRAQLGLRLYAEEETLGGLNLYSTDSPTIADDALQLAELFATHAAIALGRSRTEQQLTEALGTRKVIGQAIGIVSERFQIDETRAFDYLVRASTTGNVKLRTLAEEVVTTTNDKYRRTGQDG